MPIRSLDAVPASASTTASSKHVGQGEGDSKVGDVIGQDGQGSRARARASRPASSPGVDYYEAEVTIDELAALIFEDLGLPNLEAEAQAGDRVRDDPLHRDPQDGIMSNLDKRRTILENIKRNARDGQRRASAASRNDDLRFKTWERDDPSTSRTPWSSR